MANKKVVVAFSGGLDTSYTVMKLTQDGWDVYAACANTGGFSEEQLKKNQENAYKLGAVKYVTLDVTQEYYAKSLKYMIFGNVLRNNCYPISVSSERIFQAIAIARYAKEIGADAIAHGSTGAGNDQIRFDMTFSLARTRWPHAKIFSLTSGAAVMAMNTALGYQPVTFADLTEDEAFWKGCEGCVNVDVLHRTGRKYCICTAMLYDPTEHLPAKIPDEVIERINKIDGKESF